MTELQLCCGSDPYSEEAANLSSLRDPHKSIVKHLNNAGCALKSLKTLSLSGIVTSDSHLSALLMSHQGTLCALKLQNFYLERADESTVRPCFVSMLLQIHDMRMKLFKYNGRFWNGGRQKLDVGYHGPSDYAARNETLLTCIRQNIAAWVVNQDTETDCSIERLRIGPVDQDLQFPAGFTGTTAYAEQQLHGTDFFWQMLHLDFGVLGSLQDLSSLNDDANNSASTADWIEEVLDYDHYPDSDSEVVVS